MKTLLVGINAKYIHTNLAIRYLYTYTKDEFDVCFMEFTIKNPVDNIISEILQLNPQLIGFSCYIWNIELIKKIIPIIKSYNKNIKILLGGPEVSYDCEYFFNTIPIDYIIVKEGEYSFKALLNALQNNLPKNNIPQLYYRESDKIVANNNEYTIDLNCLKSPYRLEVDKKNLPNRIQYIESSRGCPFHCSYCLASLEKQVRYFSIDFIKQELLYLMNNGAKTFKFLDRTFNIRKDYALNIFEFIIHNHKSGCIFQFEISGELLDEEIITYLNKNAPKNLIRFEIGVQSTNEHTNQLVLRKQNFAKLKHNIELIQKGGIIDLHLDLIAGLPKENYQSFIKTFNDVFSLFPHELQLGFLKMLRGTKIRKEAADYQYHYQEIAPYEVIANEDLSPFELSKIHAAEEILEKYYNSHRFDQTITYILKTYYKDNYYTFFETYGLFYEAHFSKQDYQVHDLCLRLLEYLKHTEIDINNIESLLIYDYLKLAKTRPKIWYQTKLTKEERLALFKDFINNNPT
ncbi:MAG TPA: radical SAM protein, partial [Haloplasmataceae bacterium]